MARRAPLIRAALLAAWLAAQGCRVEDVVLVPPLDAPASVGLLGLRIEPASIRLVEDGAPPWEEVPLHAIGRYDDGERELREGVSWSVEDPRLGSVADGVLTSSGLAGTGGVVAGVGERSARAELTITLDVTRIDPGLPPGIADDFPSDTSADAIDAARLAVVYPATETMFPGNARGIRHEWRADAGLDRFQLSFENALVRVRIYTDQRRFVPDEAAWRWLAGSSPGGSVEMRVRGLAHDAPARIYRSAPVTLLYARGEIPGALYYWSTSVQGIMRARLDAPLATRAFPSTGQRCVGCHTISRDGRRIAYVADEQLELGSLPDGGPGSPQGGSYGWGSFSPDAARLVYASAGRLSVLDLAGGQRIAVPLPGRARATHPCWSPDGSYIAIAYSERPEDEDDFGDQSVAGTSLARLPVAPDGRIGDPEILVRSMRDEDTITFPAVSPDGLLIAYARARGASKDNSSSELFLIRADGSGGPVALPRANRRVGERASVTGIGNTMPTWALGTRPDLAWLVFSSVRAYGLETPDPRRDQLWAAGVDLARVRSGDDPSSSAFWLPFQTLGEGNHRAQWTPDP